MPLAENGFGLLPVTEVAPELLAAFRCGKDHLDAFLANSVGMHEDRLGLTTVVFHRDVQDAVVGYFTLANDAVPLNTSEQAELGLRDDVALTAFPGVKIGRFAVAQNLQGQGVGAQLLELVLGEILDSESLSAARLAIVDADNDPPVLRFYERHGFERSLWAEKQARNHGGRASPAAVKMIRDILRTL